MTNIDTLDSYNTKILKSFYPCHHTAQIEEALLVLKSIDLTLNNSL